MNKNLGVKVILMFAVIATMATLPTGAFSQTDSSKDAFVGTIEKIDSEAKMVYVKSKDGVVKAFKWTKKTAAFGIKEAAVWTDHTVHIGAHVVVRSLKVAGEDTIKGIHWFGHGTVAVAEAVVKHVGKGSKKIALAVSGEAKQIYDVSEHALVSTGKTISHGSKEIEKKTEKEVMATVHVIEHNGKKIVHFIEHKTSQ